jgi:CDGSH-type Zn-finger protein
MGAPTITCSPDGPYIVKGLAQLSNSKGEKLAIEPTVALCRCGGSASKPFCDGTHKKNGFSGARLADPAKNRRRDYAGAKITIHDNRAICAHAGHCTEGLAAVFRYGEKPWIDADGAGAAAAIATIRRCPSGALSYSIDGVEHRDLERPAAILVDKDGPYVVTGGLVLAGEAWGDGASTEHYTLCRCGASKNKPFCDGSHFDAGFNDAKN